MIEASFGLGEAVVTGLVVPDRYRLAPDGALLDLETGEKDLQVVVTEGGGTAQVDVATERVHARALDDPVLDELARIATRCENTFSAPCDLEWAVADGRLWLLQARPVTT